MSPKNPNPVPKVLRLPTVQTQICVFRGWKKWLKSRFCLCSLTPRYEKKYECSTLQDAYWAWCTVFWFASLKFRSYSRALPFVEISVFWMSKVYVCRKLSITRDHANCASMSVSRTIISTRQYSKIRFIVYAPYEYPWGTGWVIMVSLAFWIVIPSKIRETCPLEPLSRQKQLSVLFQS